jgi:hypothetical protein
MPGFVNGDGVPISDNSEAQTADTAFAENVVV